MTERPRSKLNFGQIVARLKITLIGPLSVSLSNFFVSFLLIPLIEPAQFGFFALTMTFVQFVFGLTNATASTPLSLLLNQGGDGWIRQYAAIRMVNYMVSAAAAVLVVLSGLYFEAGTVATICFSLFAFLSSQRWFSRSVQYARHDVRRAAISDLAYSGALVAAVGTAALFRASFEVFSMALVFAATVGSGSFLLGTVPIPKPEGRVSIREYGEIWRTQVRWALLGVVTTEMTSNGHAYLVSFLASLHDFAPIAVAVLCWRPVATLFPTLTIAERPVMARHIANGDVEAARQTARMFRTTLQLALGANFVGLLVCWWLFQDKIAHLDYSQETLVVSTMLWFVVVAFRIFRVPESTFIQAAKRFRELAWTSMVAAPISLSVAAIMILVFDPTTSIIGIIAGEAAMTTGVLILAKKVIADAKNQDCNRSADV